jgi:hypothetical protein
VEPLVAEVTKSGETPIQVDFKRTVKGLNLTIKALPSVEAFVKEFGNGEAVDIRTMGRYWAPINQDTMMVYNMANNAGVIQGDGVGFRLDRAGYNILLDGELTPSGKMNNVVNLSYLRLAGISEGAGITFQVKGVFSDTNVKEMRDLTALALRRFYIYYMKPMRLSVMICTQEIP